MGLYVNIIILLQQGIHEDVCEGYRPIKGLVGVIGENDLFVKCLSLSGVLDNGIY